MPRSSRQRANAACCASTEDAGEEEDAIARRRGRGRGGERDARSDGRETGRSGFRWWSVPRPTRGRETPGDAPARGAAARGAIERIAATYEREARGRARDEK